jgi:hypothetical protein
MSANQPQVNPNDLTITDLATMKTIIDIASERNAFKPNEMAAVGIVYNKLEIFLKTVEEQQKAAQVAAKADDNLATETAEAEDPKDA